MKKTKTAKQKWRIVGDREKACLEFLDVASIRITGSVVRLSFDPKDLTAGLKALQSAAKKKGA
jgi:hypothetical protein